MPGRCTLGVFGAESAVISDVRHTDNTDNTAGPCTTIYEHAEFREPPQEC